MIKMSFDDFVEGGLTGSEAVNVAQFIVEAGIDCIEVSGGILSETKDRIAVKGIDRGRKGSIFPALCEIAERKGPYTGYVGGRLSIIGCCSACIGGRRRGFHFHVQTVHTGTSID